MPHRSLSGDFIGVSGAAEAPPSYDLVLTTQEFEQKAASVAEQTASEAQHVSGPADNGKRRRDPYEEFEDWDDARFEAAAAAYQARLARQHANAGAGSSLAATSAPSSAYRSQSPGRPGPSHRWESQYTSLPLQEKASQLPAPVNTSPMTQRALPPRPTEQFRDAGPASPPNVPALTSPRHVSDIKTSMPWMNTGMSDDGHGRGRPSMDAPPPFAPIASPTSEYSESFDLPPPHRSRQSTISSPAVQSAPSAAFRDIPPPPPINIPQAPASAPLLPTSSSSPPPLPQLTHRRSEIPSSMATPRAPPPQQRRSEIPSSNPRPPNSVGPRPFVLQEKKSFSNEPSSAARELYASARVKTSAPSVRPDFNKIAYQNHLPNSTAGDSHIQPSLYSAAVSSVLNTRTLPAAPIPRQTMPPEQYSQPYQQPYQQANPYTSPPTAPASAFYGQAAPNFNPGFYVQSQPMYPQYQSQVQQQPPPPQGYPPTAAQNNWSPSPDTWRQNYGRY